ncbi:MAG: amidohydrolase family protein [Spirochaetia bacterium]|nr:amidohydrolase family protein [Spirochaetia bacterium]
MSGKGTVIIKNAAAIVSCDENDTVYHDSDILIEGPKILKIDDKIDDEPADEIIDARGKFVYPGMVNTHHHFFQTFVRNLTTIDYPNMLVLDWIEEIYKIFKLIDPDVIYYSSLTAMADLLKHGCTTAFDHQYCYPRSAGKQLVDRQMEAAQQLGIRYHAGRGANTLPHKDGGNVPEEMVETTEEFIADCERLIDMFHDPEPYSMRQIVVAPCQPINCYKDTFSQSLELARDKGVYLHTHLGEGENPAILERWGVRTLKWCEEIGFAGPDVWYAHGWELTPEEYKVMGETGTGLSHCPAPATLGGFPIIDIPSMKKNGMRLSLGCDGSATNDSSNMLDSLRMAYLMQSYHSKSRGGAPSGYEMLKLATKGGSHMIGRNDLGSLEPGKGADLFMIDTERLDLAGALHDPGNLLARVGVTGDVWLTMVNGKVVYSDGILTGVDEIRLAREAEEVCTRVLREKSSKFY